MAALSANSEHCEASLMICLGSTYLVETEFFFVESIVNKGKN